MGNSIRPPGLGRIPQEEVTDAYKQQRANHTCVEIQGMTKVFPTSTGLKVAVDNINLTMYSGQITAILGHNGILINTPPPNIQYSQQIYTTYSLLMY